MSEGVQGRVCVHKQVEKYEEYKAKVISLENIQFLFYFSSSTEI